MSYCRFSNGDVYMYLHADGFIECCSCSFEPTTKTNMGALAKMLGLTPKTHPELYEDFDMPGSAQFNLRSEAIEHLLKHREAGHSIPKYAIEKLNKEIRNDGDSVKPDEDGASSIVDLGS